MLPPLARGIFTRAGLVEAGGGTIMALAGRGAWG
jgi:hypothetical protein